MAETLFGRTWNNSRGELDGWEFVLDGDVVRYRYDALFDADTDDVDAGSGNFPKDEFARFLAAFREKGTATIGAPGNLVTLNRIDDRVNVSMSGGCGTFCTWIKELPPRAYELLGV